MDTEQFPILERGIYANHAAIAPWPAVTARAVAEFAQENADRGPAHYREWIEREQALRNMLATLVNAESGNDIALLKNTSEGVSLVAFGLPWEPGDNIVLPAGEFPSNRLPWLAQQARGVEVREVDIRADHPEQALLAAMDDRTRVLAVSSVQFNDGLRLRLEPLGEACLEADVLFFVDAIQHLGALPFDVQAANVGCLAAGAHKWLLGPEGMALFYCSEQVRSLIGLTQAGWHMYDYPWNFERDDWTPSNKARRFEAGSPNSLGQVALHASLSLLLEHGMESVSARVLGNTRRLISGLSAMPGVELASLTERDRLSGIVAFRVADSRSRDVFKRLMQAGVSCAFRAGCVRLSPHYYQDEGVMDALLERVESCL